MLSGRVSVQSRTVNSRKYGYITYSFADVLIYPPSFCTLYICVRICEDAEGNSVGITAILFFIANPRASLVSFVGRKGYNQVPIHLYFLAFFVLLYFVITNYLIHVLT